MGLETTPGATVYQGEDKLLNFRLADQWGNPFDISTATQIEALFPNTDGTTLEILLVPVSGPSQLTIVNGGGGKFSVRLLAAQTKLMLIGNPIAVEVRVTIGGYISVSQIPNALSVAPSLFPTTS